MSKRTGVPVGILYAVALTESGVRGSLHPFALNIDGSSRYPVSANHAIRQFEDARKHGARFIDVGCMQINYQFHRDKFKSIEEMLRPAENVAYGAKFLKTLKRREGTWARAVARYHAGRNNTKAHKKYVCSVVNNMVTTGLGSWTTEARQFCSK